MSSIAAELKSTGVTPLTRTRQKEGSASLVLRASGLTRWKRALFLNVLLPGALACHASDEAGSCFTFFVYWSGAQLYLSRG